ncbi:MOB kinase activator 2 isoform X2 [Callorhinchus milii]|nr:MOB kinase activator 2 isoform X2 [Callorhinchus milii]
MDWLMGKTAKSKLDEKPPCPEEKKLYMEVEYTAARVSDVDLPLLVALPSEIDQNEWLANNTMTFFNHINLQYSAISEFCTAETCPVMTACNTQYFWTDERGKKIKCTAPQYIDLVMTHIQKLLTDEEIFPTKYGKAFPSSFDTLVQKISRFLFHVLAHIYCAHFKEVVALELYPHLNTLYAHFLTFVRQFSLIDPKETAIMRDLTDILLNSPPIPQNNLNHR